MIDQSKKAQQTAFDEAQTFIEDYKASLDELHGLTITTSNLKYMTRTQREELYKGLLENCAKLEDSTKALIKGLREIRRARLRDDTHIGEVALTMAYLGRSIDAGARSWSQLSQDESARLDEDQP